MEEASKSQTTIGGDGDRGAGGFTEELRSGRPIHINNHCNINYHNHYHYHNQNEANGDEEQNPLKQSVPINATPSNNAIEQAPSVSLNLSSPRTTKPYVQIQNGTAGKNYFLSISGVNIMVAPSDKLCDESQQWYKICSTINDSMGRPAFSLVNRLTGQAIQYRAPFRDGHLGSVTLVSYNPEVLDKLIFWTREFGYEDDEPTVECFRTINPVSDTKLNLRMWPYANETAAGYDLSFTSGFTYICTDNLWKIIYY